MEAGLITPETRLACPGSWDLGNITFRNWNPRHEGQLDLSDSLMRSCDTFFYELAWRQYQREEAQLDAEGAADELLPRVAADFGFGRLVGIDLPEGVEQPGVIPSREWKRSYWERTKETNCVLAAEAQPGTYAHQLYTELCEEGYRFRGGDAVNSSIGQGDVLTTPLQVAAAYAAVANGGTLYSPRIGQEVRAPDGSLVRTIEPQPLGTLPLTEAQVAEIQRGSRTWSWPRAAPPPAPSVASRSTSTRSPARRAPPSTARACPTPGSPPTRRSTTPSTSWWSRSRRAAGGRRPPPRSRDAYWRRRSGSR
jgi:penicillin-binding protein 2